MSEWKRKTDGRRERERKKERKRERERERERVCVCVSECVSEWVSEWVSVCGYLTGWTSFLPEGHKLSISSHLVHCLPFRCSQPPAIAAAVCAFPSVRAAAETAIAVIQSAVPIARIGKDESNNDNVVRNIVKNLVYFVGVTYNE